MDLFVTEANHNHDGMKIVGIRKEVKSKIETLFGSGITKPNQIICHLRNEGFDVPSKMQITNFISVIRKKTEPAIVSIGQLCQLCEENEDTPVDEDQPFFVGKIIDATEKKFHVMASTLRLLSNSTKSKALHADATYKLLFEGFPVLVVGTTDKNRHFHPLGVALSSATYRERVPLRQFFGCILKLLRNWSQDRCPEFPNPKIFHLTPSISNLLMSASYTWARENKSVRFKSVEDTLIQCICPANGMSLRKEEIDRVLGLFMRMSWKKFESYATSKSKLWIVNFNLSNWITSSCSCPIFKKEYICKHIIRIGIIKKIINVPENLKTDCIGYKPKRGRKKIVGKALVVD